MRSPSQRRTYQIGELAVRSGLTPDALRYYERLGLLPPPQRSGGGYRLYEEATLDRLRFIRQAQSLGLTLRERSSAPWIDIRYGPTNRHRSARVLNVKEQRC